MRSRGVEMATFNPSEAVNPQEDAPAHLEKSHVLFRFSDRNERLVISNLSQVIILSVSLLLSSCAPDTSCEDRCHREYAREKEWCKEHRKGFEYSKCVDAALDAHDNTCIKNCTE